MLLKINPNCGITPVIATYSYTIPHVTRFEDSKPYDGGLVRAKRGARLYLTHRAYTDPNPQEAERVSLKHMQLLVGWCLKIACRNTVSNPKTI